MPSPWTSPPVFETITAAVENPEATQAVILVHPLDYDRVLAHMDRMTEELIKDIGEMFRNRKIEALEVSYRPVFERFMDLYKSFVRPDPDVPMNYGRAITDAEPTFVEFKLTAWLESLEDKSKTDRDIAYFKAALTRTML